MILLSRALYHWAKPINIQVKNIVLKDEMKMIPLPFMNVPAVVFLKREHCNKNMLFAYTVTFAYTVDIQQQEMQTCAVQ